MKPLFICLVIAGLAVACARKNEKLESKQDSAIQGTSSSDQGQDRGGGDAKLVRKRIMDSKREDLVHSVRSAFQNDLGPTNVLSLLSGFANSNEQLADDSNNAILKLMRAKGLGADLYKSKFILADSCKDKDGIERTAVSSMNQPGSDICINPIRIVEEYGPYIQDSDLIGLLMHEFAHHYGFLDADHSFASAVALDYQLDNENRNQDGEPLNYLIH